MMHLTIHIRKATDTILLVLDNYISRTIHDVDRGLTIYIWVFVHVCVGVCVHNCLHTYNHVSQYVYIRDTIKDSFSITAESYLLEWGVHLNVELKIFPEKRVAVYYIYNN